jgi:hypothetical protein
MSPRLQPGSLGTLSTKPASYVEYVPSLDTAAASAIAAADAYIEEISTENAAKYSDGYADFRSFPTPMPYVTQTAGAGKTSTDLSHKLAATQFIEFMPPKGSGGMSSQNDGVHGAALIYNQPLPVISSPFDHTAALSGAGGDDVASSSPPPHSAVEPKLTLSNLGIDAKHAVSITPYAGVTSHVITDKVARTRLERKLQSPEAAPSKMHFNFRRASVGDNAAAVIYRQPGPSELERMVRRQRLSTQLQVSSCADALLLPPTSALCPPLPPLLCSALNLAASPTHHPAVHSH